MSDNDQRIIDCLEEVLQKHKLRPRVDTSTMAGGRLFGAFERRARQEVTSQMNFFSKELQRPVHLFLCEDLTYGAAASHRDYDFIILHTGVIPALLDFCRRMLSADELWPHVGSIMGGSDITSDQNNIINIRACEVWCNLPPAMPIDPIRDAFAILFSQECLAFIVRHELAHLLLGHCEFIEKMNLDAFMQDTDGKLPTGSDPLTMQALEVGADGHAAIWGLEEIYSKNKPFDTFPEPAKSAFECFYGKNEEEAVFNYLLVIFLVFRLFDEKAWDTKTILSRQHPPTLFRFQAVCVHLYEHIQGLNNKTRLEDFSRCINRIWEEGEFIFAQTLGREPDKNLASQVWSKESEKHFRLLSERVKQLPASLLEITRVSLL